MNRFNVRKVAVLGAGVMGAQIAAHLVNVKVPVVPLNYQIAKSCFTELPLETLTSNT